MKIFRILTILVLVTFVSTRGQTLSVEKVNKESDTGDETLFAPVFEIDAATYVVGAGDEFYISIRGILEVDYKSLVNPEGLLFLPKIGLIDVNQLSLEKAKERVVESIRNNYRDVEIDISLVNVRKVKVDVIGFVNNSGTFTLPANTRLYGLIQQLGELDESCDLRNIKLVATDDEEKFYDITAYTLLQNEEENPYLSHIKTVVFYKTDEFVTVYGSVIKPSRFPYKKNEPILHLVALGGGFSSNAKRDTIEVVRFDENHEKLFSIFYDYEELKGLDATLEPGDKVIIRKLPEYKIDRMVEVTGEVQYPGMYKIRKNGTTLYEVISVFAGGFTVDASLKDAYIQRQVGIDKPDPELERLRSIPRSDLTDDEYDYLKARSRERKGRMVVDFIGLFENGNLTEDVVLRRDDIIVIPEKIDYISIVGQVVKPGNIVFDENLSVQDYINISGGFSWRAIDDDIRIIKSYSGEWVELDDLEKLEPGDIIWVPEDPPAPEFWDVFRDTMLVLGQIAAVVTSVVAIAVATR